MKHLVAASLVVLFTVNVAAAEPPAAADCEAKALSKDGKPLAGAAKQSFLKKCEADALTAIRANCETKAVSKEGKPLAGAAKTSFMKKCEAGG